MADDDETTDDDDDDLTPEEKAERKAAKAHQELADGADRALNRWHEAAPEERRVAVIDGYVATGELDHVTAGVDELEIAVVEAAFAGRIECDVLAPLGLSLADWQAHIDEADLPEFRRAVVEGDWQCLIDHARAAKKMRHDMGI